MIRFVVSRLLYGGLVLVLVTILVSSIIYLSPVDPARLTFGQRMDEATVQSKREQLGLDLPLYSQVLLYLKDVSPIYIGSAAGWRPEYRGSHLSIGSLQLGIKSPYMRESYQSGVDVGHLILSAFANTLLLTLVALLLAIVLGISLGLLAGFSHGTWIDRVIILISTVGFSVPSYVTAIVLGVIFGYYLRDFTGLNIQGSLFELDDLGDEVTVWKNLLLPALALGVRPVAIITQLMRSSYLDEVSKKFVLAAEAKGLSRAKVIRDHVLRNAMNPVITALSGWTAALLAGAFFVEFIFNYKGLGYVTVQALINYDIPVVLGALLFTSALFVVINILVDVTYSLLDPRINLA